MVGHASSEVTRKWVLLVAPCHGFGVSTPMAEQVRRDPRLVSRLAQPWSTAVVLERLAHGGGSTNWYLARTEADLMAIADVLAGGSRITLFIDEQLFVGHDSEAQRLRMFDAAAGSREVLVGYPVSGEVGLQVELPTGSSELAEARPR